VTQTFKNLRFANPSPINYLQTPHHPSHACGNHPPCILNSGGRNTPPTLLLKKAAKRAKFSPFVKNKLFVFNKISEKAG
jgi:hypothetical protein